MLIWEGGAERGWGDFRLQERQSRVEGVRHTVWANNVGWLWSLAEPNECGQGEKGDRITALKCRAKKHSLFSQKWGATEGLGPE